MRGAKRHLRRVKRLEEIPVSFTVRSGVGFDARPVKAHGAICQDWKMIDVAIVGMLDDDLGLQDRGSEIAV
jgi:hypothetical protein